MALVGAASVALTWPLGGGEVGVVTLTCWWAQAEVMSNAAAKENKRIGSAEKRPRQAEVRVGYARRGQWLR